MKTLRLQYFAVLREQRGLKEETIETTASTPAELYAQLQSEHSLPLSPDQLRAAINGEFATMDASLADQDEVVFIPPVAGG